MRGSRESNDDDGDEDDEEDEEEEERNLSQLKNSMVLYSSYFWQVVLLSVEWGYV